MNSGRRCDCGVDEWKKTTDEEGRAVYACASCGHVDARQITAAPAGEQIPGIGCYRVLPKFIE